MLWYCAEGTAIRAGRRRNGYESAERVEKLSPVKLRLHQFLSKTGEFASKREAKDAVWAGDVTVGDRVVKDIAFQFNPNTKAVCYKGQRLQLPTQHRTFLLNKPRGVICSRLNAQESELGKTSVFSLFEAHLSSVDADRLITVGRLDEDTTGLLLVTTDGDLVHRIASPEAHVSKVYGVKTARPVSEEECQLLARGVEIDLEVNGTVEQYRTSSIELPFVDESGQTVLRLHEGKKRQVRRMFAALGHEVVALHRRQIGGLVLADWPLREGEFVLLNENDVATIFAQS